jgi:wyosine [tRNA(Phe)-imidazoG37] synthetase (radical SAM superfamily)
MEVFLMEGVNSSPGQIRRIAEIATQIKPDKIHLNTAVRPPAEKNVHPVSKEKLNSFCALFTPPAEPIASFSASKSQKSQIVHTKQLVGLIHRHPATAPQLAATIGVCAEDIVNTLAPLIADGTLATEMRGNELYYR